MPISVRDAVPSQSMPERSVFMAQSLVWAAGGSGASTQRSSGNIMKRIGGIVTAIAKKSFYIAVKG